MSERLSFSSPGSPQYPVPCPLCLEHPCLYQTPSRMELSVTSTHGLLRKPLGTVAVHTPSVLAVFRVCSERACLWAHQPEEKPLKDRALFLCSPLLQAAPARPRLVLRSMGQEQGQESENVFIPFSVEIVPITSSTLNRTLTQFGNSNNIKQNH